METRLLTRREQFPSDPVLRDALGPTYAVYQDLLARMTAPPLQLEPVWNYYNDGKSWLCKVQHRKKTVLWLSIWDGHFKTSFYFSAKNSEGVLHLDIDDAVKERFRATEFRGKLKALTIDVRAAAQLEGLLKIVEYRKHN